MKIDKKRLLTIASGAIVGVFSGLAYWQMTGCDNQSCIISGNPYVASAYGALLFGLIADGFHNSNKSTNKEHEHH